MSITSLNSSAISGTPTRATLAERIDTKPGGTTLSGIATATADGVSATVSFSGKALHALEHAGEAVVDGAEDLALGAWHAVQAAAQGVEHAGEAAVDAVEDGAHEVASAVTSTARELGHYASVALHAVGDGLTDVASGTVMAASAGGKTLAALI